MARQPRPPDFPEWLHTNGHPPRHHIPSLTLRADLYDQWFRWRCAIGHPPDRENMGHGGHGNPLSRVDPHVELVLVAPSGRRARRHRQDGHGEKVG